MGFFKVLGLAAVGVGAVAAAPFTGGGSLLAGASLAASLTGAGAVAAAVGAGAAGAAAGVYLNNSEKNEQQKRENRAREEGKVAGERVASEKYAGMMQELIARFRTYEDFSRKLVGLFAVGIAVANCDGVISGEEVDDLNELVAGISHSDLPQHVKDSVSKLRHNPPSFEEAVRKAKEYGCAATDVDAIIDVIAHSDGVITSDEVVLITCWEGQKAQFALQ